MSIGFTWVRTKPAFPSGAPVERMGASAMPGSNSKPLMGVGAAAAAFQKNGEASAFRSEPVVSPGSCSPGTFV